MAVTSLLPVISNVTVLFTNKCNINCSHCYVGSNRLGDFGLKSETVYKIIDVVAGMPSTPLFTLSGGEPLYRKNDCLEILKYAYPKVKAQLLTNGILITRDIADRLSDLDISIRISLDGVTPLENDKIRGAGAFKNTLQGINNLVNANFPLQKLTLCTTICDFTPHVIDSFIRLCERLQINSIRFHALCRMGRGIDMIKSLYGQEDSSTILMNKKPFVDTFEGLDIKGWDFSPIDTEENIFHEININSNGAVYPYVVYDYLKPRTHEVSIGNVNETDFRDILQSDQMSESILLKFLALKRNSRNDSRAYTAIRSN